MTRFLPAALILAACAATPAPERLSARWIAFETGTDASLRGIDAVDARTVWATGSNGTVLRTTDGGATWNVTRIAGFETGELRDVHALDAERAYVLCVTRPASVLYTDDAGATWNELYRSPQPDAFLDSFTFFDDQHACLFGDPIGGAFLLLTSSDGGANWTAARDVPAAHSEEAAFAASGTCVVSHGAKHAWIGTGGGSTRVLRSTDGGQTWRAAATPMAAGKNTTGIYSIAFRDALHGVVVGGDYTAPASIERNAAYSRDGGVTWMPVEPNVAPRGHRAAVGWVPGRERTLVTVGRGGSDYSLDDGKSWMALGEEGYYALAFAPSGAVWAVGSKGRAARLVID